MTGLLVSVRSAGEAAIALRGGADIIDVKEPRWGSLGAATTETRRAVCERVAERVPLSVALGELLSCDLGDTAANLHGYRFAKLGLAGCRAITNWFEVWRDALSVLPSTIVPVAVAYADAQCARAPHPEDVVMNAHRVGCRAILFDTFEKSQADLFHHIPPRRLTPMIQQSKQAGLLVVLAGSLSMSSMETAISLAPDFVAVRGAVCRGDRNATIDEALVRELRVQVECASRIEQSTRICQVKS